MNQKKESKESLFLFNELKPTIITLYKEYNYLNLTLKKFELLCKDIIFNICESNNNISEKKCIELLQKGIDTYIQKQLNNTQKRDALLSNFINQKINIHEGYKENLEEIRKINNFLIRYEAEETPELYSNLLNYSNVYKLIENIINKKIDVINTQGLEIIDENPNIQLLLEMYCEINGIKYQNLHIETFKEEYDNDMKIKTLDSFGLYLSQIAKPLLTKEEEQRLFILKEKGDPKATEKLIEHNLQLVVHVAKPYMGKGLDILDIIQDGNMGLVNAIEHFDYKKGYKLSTYATWWIRQSIQRGIMNTVRPIRLPVHLCEKINKYGSTKDKLEKELKREPTKEEICDRMNITLSQLKELEKATQNVVSINVMIGKDEDSDTELGEFIASESTIEEEYLKNSMLEELLFMLDRINMMEREKLVIKLRFGLYDGDAKTLEEVGQLLGVTRERVRQIEAKALRKIRNSPQILRMASLIDIDPKTNQFTRRYYIK